MEKPSNEWFSNFGERHECVFTVSGQGKNRIESILVRAKCIDTNGEGKEELR